MTGRLFYGDYLFYLNVIFNYKHYFYSNHRLSTIWSLEQCLEFMYFDQVTNDKIIYIECSLVCISSRQLSFYLQVHSMQKSIKTVPAASGSTSIYTAVS